MSDISLGDMANTETRTAPVDLSQYHAGQIIQHSATMTAVGRYVRDGRDAFRRPVYRWVAVAWRSTHTVRDGSDGETITTTSPDCRTRDEAEAWLESRGLRLGGSYWHAATAEVAS